MGGWKRTWEAISFEVVMTAIALIALIVIIAPSLVVLIVSFTNGFSLKFPPPGTRRGGTPNCGMRGNCILRQRTVSLSRCGRLACRSCSVLPQHLPLHARRIYRHACSISLFMSPLVLPALAFGLSALMLFSLVGLPVSPLTLVIGHTVVCVPYVVRNTVAALAQLEPTLLESSAILGASRLYTFDGSYCR